MSKQWFYQDARAGYLHANKLSKRLRYYLQTDCKFRQFCDLKEALGKGAGDTVDYRLITKIRTGGLTTGIGERENIPVDSFRIKTDQVAVTEFGNSIEFTGKAKMLSAWDLATIVKRVLKDDAVETIDSVIEHQFDQTLVRYVGTSANGGTFFRNGYAGIANNTPMYPFHVKEIVDDLRTRNVPTYDGENYVCLGTAFALRNLKDELEDINKYTSEGRKPILNGEVGRYYGCRFVEVNHGVDTGGFDLGLSSEAYFFGADTVAEAIALPEEVRIKEPENYGRFQGIAWYGIFGYKLEWADRRRSDSDPAYSRIIKWDSASGSNSSSASTYSRSYDSFPSESESVGFILDG